MRNEQEVFQRESSQNMMSKSYIKVFFILGKYTTRWRGLSMMKDSLDMVIYQQLFWEVKPRTIFETGTYTGACAL